MREKSDPLVTLLCHLFMGIRIGIMGRDIDMARAVCHAARAAARSFHELDEHDNATRTRTARGGLKAKCE